MDQQLDERLKAIEEQLAENTKIVTKIRRVQKRASTIRALYWIFIILLGLGAFYFITPFIDQLKSVYGVGEGGGSNFSDVIKQVKTYKDGM
jgi:predicted PurR-regulated permease PerM